MSSGGGGNTSHDPPTVDSSALLNCPKIPLRQHGADKDRLLHPSIGYGTYKVGYVPASASSAAAAAATTTTATTKGGGDSNDDNNDAVTIVGNALKAGYRFLECAEFYGNQAAVGEAIVRSGIDRSELFLCSKVWTTTIEQGPGAIRARLEETLSELRTDYLDLYLIHWPVPTHHVAAYRTLLELRDEGKIRGVGVSNYAWEDYVELKEAIVSWAAASDRSSGSCSKIDVDADLPLVNQIEINPFLYRKNTIANFVEEGVVLQSYRSLRDGRVMDDARLVAMGAKYGNKSPAQILGRWCIQHGFVYTPKSIRVGRMQENAAVFDFELDGQDMDVLDNLTTPEALATFQDLYRKCVNRDTSKDGTMDGVKLSITVD
jgi:diketogulonate reductase-like aldo/keto reductase